MKILSNFGSEMVWERSRVKLQNKDWERGRIKLQKLQGARSCYATKKTGSEAVLSNKKDWARSRVKRRTS